MSRLLLPLLVGLLTASCRAAPTSVATDLFAGQSLAGWEYVTVPAADIGTVCHFTAEGVLAVAGKPVGYLATKAEYQNFTLHAEWRWPKDAAKNSNSGILLCITGGPKDRAWPVSFQVQTKPTRGGDVLPMAGATFAEALSTPAGAKTPQLDRKAESSEKPLGEWNACDIVCRDGAIEITINGVRQNWVTQASPRAGRVGFQLEGTPYELRNVRLAVLD